MADTAQAVITPGGGGQAEPVEPAGITHLVGQRRTVCSESVRFRPTVGNHPIGWHPNGLGFLREEGKPLIG